MAILMVAIGGAFGAIARYLTYQAFETRQAHSFPWGTLVINVTGCFALGILIALAARVGPFQRHVLLIGATGFLGSYTTFSTFGFETLQLMSTGRPVWAACSVAANLFVGLAAVWLGRSLTMGL